MDEPLIYRLGIAVGIGLIVGLERGWKTRDQHAGQRLAGVRTFSLAALLGGALAAVATPDRYVVFAAGALAVGALVIAGYLISVRETRDFGMTTELALLTTFALGALSVLGAPFEAVAAAVVMSLLLGFKAEFHYAIEKLERHELLATLQLLAIAVVLVPLLPDRELGPWQAINPRVIGLLVLLIAGLSYVGYFAVRVLGPRLGLVLTAVLGGLTSSTAVTVAYARRARFADTSRALLGVGIALAAATMVPRLAIEIATVNWALLADLWPTLAAVAIVPAVGGFVVLLRHERGGDATIDLANPLQLKTALIFGALLSVLFVASEGLQLWLGEGGIYAMAAITGIADVDAVTIALAESAARGTLAPEAAQRAIVLAVLVNTAAKAVLAATIGGPPMLRSATVLLGCALTAGGIVAALTLLR
jgi:uncharacterized membrane protein (DUF4010 family)